MFQLCRWEIDYNFCLTQFFQFFVQCKDHLLPLPTALWGIIQYLLIFNVAWCPSSVLLRALVYREICHQVWRLLVHSDSWFSRMTLTSWLTAQVHGVCLFRAHPILSGTGFNLFVESLIWLRWMPEIEFHSAAPSSICHFAPWTKIIQNLRRPVVDSLWLSSKLLLVVFKHLNSDALLAHPRLVAHMVVLCLVNAVLLLVATWADAVVALHPHWSLTIRQIVEGSVDRHSTLTALLLHGPELTHHCGSSTAEHLVDEILRRHVGVTGDASQFELTLGVLRSDCFKQLLVIWTCVRVRVPKSKRCAQSNQASDPLRPLVSAQLQLSPFLLQKILLLLLPQFAMQPLFFDNLEVVRNLANRRVRYSFSLAFSLNRCHPFETPILDDSRSYLLRFDLKARWPSATLVRRCESGLSPKTAFVY